MQKLIALATLASSALLAQNANLSGAWKADTQRTQLPGPPLKEYVEMFEQAGSTVTERIGSVGQRGEQRSVLSYDMSGKPVIGTYEGVPSRETVAAEAAGFTVTVATAGKPESLKRSYRFSPDGGTLTISWEMHMGPQTRQATVVLTRSAEDAAAWLNKPEELASAHFKNVKTGLKDLPVSEFIGRMHYFAWALNKNCEFCHVQGHFDSDDKEEKRTARQMIALVSDTNGKYFDNKAKVDCFTCHEFHGHPLARPQFEGEPEPNHALEPEGEHEHAAEHPTASTSK